MRMTKTMYEMMQMLLNDKSVQSLLAGQRLRGLTIWEPYATLIAWGAKKIETRSWSAPKNLIGKPLLIHAAKRFNAETKYDVERCRYALMHSETFEPPTGPCRSWTIGDTLGCVLAVSALERCEEAIGEYDELEHEFGDLRPGRYAWHLCPVFALSRPVPWRGSQGLWNVPTELREAVWIST